MIAPHSRDQSATDLHDIGRERLEDVCILFGCVVKGHSNAPVAHELERPHRWRRIAGERARGSLDDQQLGAAGDLQRKVDVALEVRVVKVVDREVDRDRERRAVPPPHVRLEQGLAQDPERELSDESGGLRLGNELHRRHDPALWVLPSHKSLDAGQLPARDRDDRLVVEEEFVVGDRAFQLEALHSSPFHSVAFCGTARPSCRYARSVATRPRCVRCT